MLLTVPIEHPYLTPALIISLIALSFTIYTHFKKESKEDTKLFDDDFRSLKVKVADQAILLQGHQSEREHLVDKNNIRMTYLEDRVAKIDQSSYQISERIGKMEIRQEMQTSTIDGMSKSIEELKCSVRDHQKELIDLIKTMNK
jgi:uncharacterized coiled-coil protein SlyX